MRLLSKSAWFGFCVVLALSAWTAPVASWQGQPEPNEKKLKAPGTKEQAEARKIVDFVFADDIKNAKKSDVIARQLAEDAEKLKDTKEGPLARRVADEARRITDETIKKLNVELLANARASFKDDPANCYVLYTELRDLAAGFGNGELALQAVDEMSLIFDVDALKMKNDVLTEVVFKSKLDTDSGKYLAGVAKELIQQALAADEFALADALGKVASKAAFYAKDAELLKNVANVNKDVQEKQKAFAHIQDYIDRLRKDPRDTGANLELGKYFGMVKVRWDKAMPYLAKGGDDPLAQLAVRDLKNPQDAHEQLDLGDGWWNLAQEAAAAAREAAKKKDRSDEPLWSRARSLWVRARYWYAQARDGLSGLNQTKAQRRVDTIDIALSPTKSAELPRGPVGEIRRFLGHDQEVKSVAFSPEGRFAVSGGNDMTVRVWELASGKVEVLTGHTKQVWAVAFRLSHRQVLSASWDATVRLWDVKWDSKSEREVRRFVHDKDVNGLALSRDGNTMLTASDDKSVRLWNVQNGMEIRRYPGHSEYVYCVAYSPDGRHFASGSVDKTVRVCEVETGTLIRVLDGHTSAVTNVAFTPDGRAVYSCGDGAAHLWDISTGRELRRFEHLRAGVQTSVLCMALSGDGRRLCTGGEDRIIHIWDTASGNEVHKFEGHTETINSLALSADGSRLLSGSLDRSVRLWGMPNR